MLENASLIGITYIANVENYCKFFISFLFQSIIYKMSYK